MRSTDEGPDRPRTLLVLAPDLLDEVFPPAVRMRLEDVADLQLPYGVSAFGTPEVDAALAASEVLLTGWGCPPIDEKVLGRAPRLRAVIHAAGTVKPFLSPEVYERGIAVSSAAAANAVPVAEFTLAAVILGAKRAFPLASLYRQRRTGRTDDDLRSHHWLGTNGLTVGVIGASRIGRRVIELLRVLDVRVLLHDPYLTTAEAELLGAEPVDLDSLMARSDAVTVHAPDTEETRGLLDARRLGLMRPGALFINTSRGRLVDTEALTRELVSGRIDAVLDVTDPEPLPAGHPLWGLPNVFLTPHLAGAQGNEIGRLGALAVDELDRFARGLPLNHPVLADELERIA